MGNDKGALSYTLSERQHCYGDKVHLLADPVLQTLLAKASVPATIQPQLNHYIESIYQQLLGIVVNSCFPREQACLDTRMKAVSDKGVFQGEIIKPDTPAICVNLARGGTLPSHLFYHQLNYLLQPDTVRQDHIYLGRKFNAHGEVEGVDVFGAKIGGGQEGAMVLFPDPMAATGTTLSHAVSHYKKSVPGTAKQYVAVHLIATPEYIQRVTAEHPDVKIFAVRLDRGLSSDRALADLPGQYPEEERGLNEQQYIVPGAGGLGELLNNAFV